MISVKNGILLVIAVLVCLFVFQQVDPPNEQSSTAISQAPDVDLSSPDTPLPSNTVQPTPTPNRFSSNPEATPLEKKDEGQMVKSNHDQRLDALNNPKFAQYDSGNIDFNLLRRTQVNRDPPPIYPEELSALDGKEVKMLGFMAPFDDLENLKTFMLFPTIVGCSFCAPPSALEVVFVRQNVEHAKFIYATILVEGTLSLWKEKSDDESHEIFLYIINDAKVTHYTGG